MNDSLLKTQMPNKKPILVTGAHRSGTTWVGKMLASGGEVAYISEPLNVLHRRGVLRAPVDRWYTYICSNNENIYLKAMQETLSFQYHTSLEIRDIHSMKDLLRMGRDWYRFQSGRFSRKRPLLKDPFAVFSIPWFIEQFNCQVVITIRHPAAFVSSLKRLGWQFDFNDLLNQPLLLRDWLSPHAEQIRKLSQQEHDVISQASWLWCMIYQVTREYEQRFPEILVARHEDLSMQPLEGFKKLFNALYLSMNERARKQIQQSSSSENPSELTLRKVHSTRMDSRSSLNNWKNRLTAGEIDQIRLITQDIAAYYYADFEW